MKKLPLLLPLLLTVHITSAQQKNIYHKGWVDFNKNGKMDVFEDPSQPINKRIADLLSQMTVEEKTCQLATLYGYKRVLKEEMPAESWKNEVWKDGIANIDEELNNLTSHTLKLSFSGIQRFTSSISTNKAFCLMPFKVPITSSSSFNKLLITTC